MTRPGIEVETINSFYKVGSQGVQVDIANEFEEVRIFLAHDRLVTVLEEMAPSVVPQVEGDGIAGQESSHEGGQAGRTAAQEEMKVIGNECPGIDARSRFFSDLPKPVKEVLAIPGVSEDGGTIDTSYHDVMQGSFNVESWPSRHGTPFVEA